MQKVHIRFTSNISCKLWRLTEVPRLQINHKFYKQCLLLGVLLFNFDFLNWSLSVQLFSSFCVFNYVNSIYQTIYSLHNLCVFFSTSITFWHSWITSLPYSGTWQEWITFLFVLSYNCSLGIIANFKRSQIFKTSSVVHNGLCY